MQAHSQNLLTWIHQPSKAIEKLNCLSMMFFYSNHGHGYEDTYIIKANHEIHRLWIEMA